MVSRLELVFAAFMAQVVTYNVSPEWGWVAFAVVLFLGQVYEDLRRRGGENEVPGEDGSRG